MIAILGLNSQFLFIHVFVSSRVYIQICLINIKHGWTSCAQDRPARITIASSEGFQVNTMMKQYLQRRNTIYTVSNVTNVLCTTVLEYISF
jgi:hypothetical protein